MKIAVVAAGCVVGPQEGFVVPERIAVAFAAAVFASNLLLVASGTGTAIAPASRVAAVAVRPWPSEPQDSESSSWTPPSPALGRTARCTNQSSAASTYSPVGRDLQEVRQ